VDADRNYRLIFNMPDHRSAQSGDTERFAALAQYLLHAQGIAVVTIVCEFAEYNACGSLQMPGKPQVRQHSIDAVGWF